MKIHIFASGSGGNCLLVTDGNTNLLVDAGISMRRTTQSLTDAGLGLCDIDGVLVTHEHSDHISGLGMLCKKHRLPVYAPHTVANRMIGMLPAVEETMHIIPVGESFVIKTLRICAFHTMHDTDESVGYRITGDGIFAIATDTGIVTDEIRAGLMGADAVVIESNHDVDMLRFGPYPFSLKKRILSERGHLSNTDCAVLAQELAETGTRQIVLGHISKHNNTPELAYKTVLLHVQGTEVSLSCAPEYGFLSISI